MQLAFTSEGDSLRVVILFRGTGKKISDDEINCYHKSVDVYWQQSTLADTKFCVDWAKNTLTPAMEDKQDYIFFCDNLEGQTALPFQGDVRKSEEIFWYSIKNATDLWQPVDARMGRIQKVLVFHEQQDWLEYDRNIDLWMGYSTEKLSVKEQRILITRWVGGAYEKLRCPECQKLRYSCFRKIGYFMTADGSEDHLITLID